MESKAGRNIGKKESKMPRPSARTNLCKERRCMQCPLCENYYSSVLKIEEHLVEFHCEQICIEETEFMSYEEFKKWKQKEEVLTNYRYSTRTSSSTSNYHIYYCHRSGYKRERGAQVKPRQNPTDKLNRCCPSRIITRSDGDKIRVEFHKTHFGHKSDKSLVLTDEKREAYKAMIEKNEDLKKIFKEVRSNCKSRSVMRLQTVVQKDKKFLKGIQKFTAFIPDKGELDDWIIQQKGSLENCILCYKTDTESCFHCFSLFTQGTDITDIADENDFILILMTKRQRDEILKFELKNVVLDCVNSVCYSVATLMLLDENGDAYPIAFCIAKKLKLKTIQHFFFTVKEAVGEVSANVFMSADSHHVFDSWVKVMGSVKHRLLTSWCLQNKWESMLRGFVEVGNINRIEVYNASCTLLTLTNCNEFNSKIEEFLRLCNKYAETVDFGKYFEKHYINRPEQWAFCYRNKLNIVNYKLELMHRRLIFCQRTGGRNNRDLESCINRLLRLADNMILFRYVKCVKTPLKIADAIVLNHKRSTSITENMIQQAKNHVWSVESNGSVETVTFLPEVQCNCSHRCNICKKCLHQFLCTCETVKRKEFCVHAHACVTYKYKKEIANNNELNESKKRKLDELGSIMQDIMGKIPKLNESDRSLTYEEVQKLYQTATSFKTTDRKRYSSLCSSV